MSHDNENAADGRTASAGGPRPPAKPAPAPAPPWAHLRCTKAHYWALEHHDASVLDLAALAQELMGQIRAAGAAHQAAIARGAALREVPTGGRMMRFEQVAVLLAWTGSGTRAEVARKVEVLALYGAEDWDGGNDGHDPDALTGTLDVRGALRAGIAADRRRLGLPVH